MEKWLFVCAKWYKIWETLLSKLCPLTGLNHVYPDAVDSYSFLNVHAYHDQLISRTLHEWYAYIFTLPTLI
jgi:hypothetical protein